MSDNDFLNESFDSTDAPAIPAPTIPFFQFHSDAGAFEFPLTLTEWQGGKVIENPLWSAVLRDSGLKLQKLGHNGKKSMAYVFDQIHFAVLGEHVFWFDKNKVVPGRFENRPNPLPEGSRFVSRRLLVGLVQEIEAARPGTLCYLTVYSTQSKFVGQTLNSFDKAVLLPAHAARLAKLREGNPNYPEPTAMLYPRYAFWMPLRAGEAINVSRPGSDIQKFMTPIIGEWNPEGESLKNLRSLFISGDTRQIIQDTLPEVKRWLAWQESRRTADASQVDDDPETDADDDLDY